MYSNFNAMTDNLMILAVILDQLLPNQERVELGNVLTSNQ